MQLPSQALSNRNYRLYFISQLISFSGTWMQTTAQAWLVYRLSHSAWWLGIVAFSSQIPAFLFSPLAGSVADQTDRRKVLLVVQCALFAQAIALGVLVLSGSVTLWEILALSVVLGVCNAFDTTFRNAFVVDMVGKGDLHSAIALNSALMNGSRIVGPAIAGVAIDLVGEGWCFMLNAVTYLAVIIALVAMTIPRVHLGKMRKDLHSFFAEALRYVRGHPVIFRITLLMAFVSFVGPAYGSLLPVFAKEVLHGTARTYAWLTGVGGVGSVFGALGVRTGETLQQTRRVITRNLAGVGAGLFVLGASRSLWFTVLGIFITGFCMMAMFPRMNSTVQAQVDDQMRGRVMSIYTMGFLGMMPLGSLIAGWLSDVIGAPRTVMGAGVICAAAAVAISASRRRKLAPQPA